MADTPDARALAALQPDARALAALQPDARALAALQPEAAPSLRVPWLLVAGTLTALVLVILVWLGHELNEGDGAAFDHAVMLAMRVPGFPDRPIGPAWLPSAMRDITALGSATVLTILVAIAATFLMLRGRLRSAMLVLVATISGSVVITIIKTLVGRSRPELIDRLMVELSNSFPSGHAANSAIVYMTLASLLFPVIRERNVRVFVLAAAMTLVGAIGISRVYLGVHWPSDVIAGWAFGGVWALLWWQIELRVLSAAPACAPTPAHP